MDEIDVAFSFYEDKDYRSDADRDSDVLRNWHAKLWSKSLPSGERLAWRREPDSYLICDSSVGPIRVSSDTIATTHSNYKHFGVEQAQEGISAVDMKQYERDFYTIGGFIIFPTRPQSINQRRGSDSTIADRFDLTLECIKRHYIGGPESPLTETLKLDREFFALFGQGADGFTAYVDFFHLQDLVSDGTIAWLDGSKRDSWDFEVRPLPQSPHAYRQYLDNVARFVEARNERIGRWCKHDA